MPAPARAIQTGAQRSSITLPAPDELARPADRSGRHGAHDRIRFSHPDQRVSYMATFRWPRPDPVGAAEDERNRGGHARPGAVGLLVPRRPVAYGPSARKPGPGGVLGRVSIGAGGQDCSGSLHVRSRGSRRLIVRARGGLGRSTAPAYRQRAERLRRGGWRSRVSVIWGMPVEQVEVVVAGSRRSSPTGRNAGWVAVRMEPDLSAAGMTSWRYGGCDGASVASVCGGVAGRGEPGESADPVSGGACQLLCAA